MEMVTGTMATLLPKLAALLRDEHRLQRSLRGEATLLKAELESMQAALESGDCPIEKPVTDRQAKVWARDVRELSYAVEDTIDAFMAHLHLGTHPSGLFRGFIVRSSRLLAKARVRRKISTDIRGVRALVEEAAARRHRYKLELDIAALAEPAPMAAPIDTRLSGVYEDAAKLVGIRSPQEELAELLMERCNDTAAAKRRLRLRVVAIVGAGGLGKTTLANVMYQLLGESSSAMPLFRCPVSRI